MFEGIMSKYSAGMAVELVAGWKDVTAPRELDCETNPRSAEPSKVGSCLNFVDQSAWLSTFARRSSRRSFTCESESQFVPRNRHNVCVRSPSERPDGFITFQDPIFTGSPSFDVVSNIKDHIPVCDDPKRKGCAYTVVKSPNCSAVGDTNTAEAHDTVDQFQGQWSEWGRRIRTWLSTTRWKGGGFA
ncbi:hypothetical protein LshimejAT787_2200010 [Lyophyllum shimeji]|uniref:Uncharacterized protein n=1 Tax=Lyophyllum shimeji TaxID=47721 RepID=A0A9P3UU80_LYOSH|nr:hypothetical protein LshimejAT787_2200010 [Lyophyllum shimeji]